MGVFDIPVVELQGLPRRLERARAAIDDRRRARQSTPRDASPTGDEHDRGTVFVQQLAADPYYTDVIGNVSTSRFRSNKREALLETKAALPRVCWGLEVHMYAFTSGWLRTSCQAPLSPFLVFTQTLINCNQRIDPKTLMDHLLDVLTQMFHWH